MRCIQKLRQLLKAMEALGVVTSTAKQRKKDQQQPHINNNKNISYPAYISIDLGLRQNRGNFSGGTFYQVILLNNTFFEDGDDKANGKGIRVAEGGRYDDLVRHFRPPSNFGSIQVSNYSTVKIPFCSGLIIFLGKMIEVLYTNALTDETWQGHQLSFIESLRRSIGNLYIGSCQTIQCIVSGENGLDLATCPERAAIASGKSTLVLLCVNKEDFFSFLGYREVSFHSSLNELPNISYIISLSSSYIVKRASSSVVDIWYIM